MKLNKGEKIVYKNHTYKNEVPDSVLLEMKIKLSRDKDGNLKTDRLVEEKPAKVVTGK